MNNNIIDNIEKNVISSFQTEKKLIDIDNLMFDEPLYNTNNNVPQNIQQNIPQNIQQNVPQNVPQNINQHIPQNVPQTINQHVPQNTNPNIQQNVPQTINPNILQNIPQTINQNIPIVSNKNVAQNTNQKKKINGDYLFNIFGVGIAHMSVYIAIVFIVVAVILYFVVYRSNSNIEKREKSVTYEEQHNINYNDQNRQSQ